MNAAAHTDTPRLSGYELIDHLGSGGYGEVWSARVPGGLTKAVKIIHGRHDESRAANELKALDRIREVRHPFVVSLERVEFVDDRLIVVSELAEGSLRDRYRACAQAGLVGIPRDELLGYLRDAADALDYLATTHGLQHLDIKPENILLLAGHAKVADFGLVKAIDDNTQSLVGGMTPAYAPPEVFKGAPCRSSDQYSLAVLYQQLLTGALPFDGVNAAELTLQHLHDEPNLEPLPIDDHFAVSRALSKNPDHRYASCAEFVRALAGDQAFASHAAGKQEGASLARRPAPSPHPQGSPSSAASAVQPTEVTQDSGLATPSTNRSLQLPSLGTASASRRPAPAFDASEFAATPTLYLGIGGAAAGALRELRQQHSEQYELTGPIPSMSMLLLDTDPRTLTSVTRNASSGAGLKPEETLCMALRRPQEYREKSDKILGWLGRRWLYNMPKSLKTEGIRPLGRLALVDHSRRTVQRIRRALTECLAPENIEASAELTGLRFRTNAVRVYVVASVSGGSGGGMAIDVAYAVRELLGRMGLDDSQVIGVTTVSTGRDPERAGLARVNAFSWLTEYAHFSDVAHAYPGDEGAGLAAHPAGVGPFDHCYLTHLGDRLDDDGFARGCKSVADYLFVDSSTPAQRFLDAARATAADHGPGRELRTFGVLRHEASPADARRDAEKLLVKLLYSNWLGDSQRDPGGHDATSTNRVVLGAGELIGRLKLDAAHLATSCRALVEEHIRADCPPAPAAPELVSRLEEINSHYSPSPELNSPLLCPTAPNRIGETPILDLVRQTTETLQTEISAWVYDRLETPGDRLSGGRQAADWLHAHCESLTASFERFAAATQQKVKGVVNQASQKGAEAAAIESRYAHLKADLAALESAALVAAGIKTELREVMQCLSELRAATASLATGTAPDASCDAEAVYAALAEADASPVKLTAALDARLQEEWTAAGLRFGQMLKTEDGRRELASGVLRVAHQCVREGLMARTGDRPIDFDGYLDLPPLAAFAGGSLQLLLAPPAAATNRDLRDGVTYIENSASDAYALHEFEGLSVPHAAVSLVTGRRDYAEFAARVHTRRDIAWTDLLQPPTDSASPFDSVSPRSQSESPTLAVQVECDTAAASAPSSPFAPATSP